MSRENEPTRLKFVGDGRRYVPGVPTSDVEIEDPEEAERLIETGLYVRAEGSRAASAPAKKEPAPPKADDGTSGE